MFLFSFIFFFYVIKKGKNYNYISIIYLIKIYKKRIQRKKIILIKLELEA